MRIIALDPGSKNFAVAVMDGRKVLETCYLTTIKSLKWDDFEEEAKGFRKRWFDLLQKYEPDCVLAERFMARPGGNGGAVGEYINVMIGILSTVNASKGIPTHLVTSAQWKNALNSHVVHEAISVPFVIYAIGTT